MGASKVFLGCLFLLSLVGVSSADNVGNLVMLENGSYVAWRASSADNLANMSGRYTVSGVATDMASSIGYLMPLFTIALVVAVTGAVFSMCAGFIGALSSPVFAWLKEVGQEVEKDEEEEVIRRKGEEKPLEDFFGLND
jgi:hypothetical protein